MRRTKLPLREIPHLKSYSLTVMDIPRLDPLSLVTTTFLTQESSIPEYALRVGKRPMIKFWRALVVLFGSGILMALNGLVVDFLVLMTALCRCTSISAFSSIHSLLNLSCDTPLPTSCNC